MRRPLLLRIDSGQDALENIDLVLDHNKDDPTGVDFRITWSPRREDPKQWLGHAGAHARFTPRRPGKRVAPCSTTL